MAAPPLPIPTLQATSYLIIQYHTNIIGVVGYNNSKYRIFTAKEAYKQIGNYMSYNAFPFINSIKLEKLSKKNLVLPLNIMAIGLVSTILIISVFGYFFFISIFFKKSIPSNDLSISSLFIENMFFLYKSSSLSITIVFFTNKLLVIITLFILKKSEFSTTFVLVFLVLYVDKKINIILKIQFGKFFSSIN